ncbi:unnamed protein product [Acanthoscelides obtectus]|uniref:Uncharacterized protein n=1 Tax=Acanthoscelides obtectus TaxID=200917 RepID=A0A9P0KC47_ACAOB|nr:unnamed protein product [Acanthoscelides obtectus]CAK1633562.1 hypothetical protein AOBTE_LOCUS8225 [Acanthoscelides obtectus]
MILQCLQQLNCLLSERCTNLNTYFQGHTVYHSRLQGHISSRILPNRKPNCKSSGNLYRNRCSSYLKK